MSTPDVKLASHVERRDIELFDRIAAQYGKKDLLPASQMARKLRLTQSLRRVALSSELKVLELGCGAGWSAKYLNDRFAYYLGVDYSEALIDFANKENRQANTTFEVRNIKDLGLTESFDVVVMIGVLHHVDDMAAAMCQAVRALKPGGWLVANEPQSGNPLVQAARHVRKLIDRSYSDDQITVSRKQIYSLFVEAGCCDVRVVPQGYFSTPFAEVIMPYQSVCKLLSSIACGTDRLLESILPSAPALSWNLVASGRKPVL